MCFVSLYLGDDGPVLPDPPVLLFKPDIVKQRHWQRFPVTAQDGLALAHIGSSEGEAPSGISWVVADVTQSCGAAQFLSCSSKLSRMVKKKIKGPIKQRDDRNL